MLSLSEIRQALLYGNENNYVLFPEARQESILNYIKTSYVNKKQIEEIKENADIAMKESSPSIIFLQHHLLDIPYL